MSNKPKSPKPNEGTKSNSGGAVAFRADLSSSEFSLPFTSFISVPKNTSADSPYLYTLRLPVGVIKKLWVEFPRGCMGLVGLQIHRAVEQLFPIPSGGWFRSDDAVYDFNFTHYVNTEPFECEFRTYNLDDTYTHTIHVTLEMTGFLKDIPGGLAELLSLVK